MIKIFKKEHNIINIKCADHLGVLKEHEATRPIPVSKLSKGV